VSADNVPLIRVGDKIVNPDGTPTEWLRNALNALILRTGTETDNAILGVINGAAELQSQIAAEAAARIAGDNAASASGDGSGVSNGGTYSAGASSGASWVTLKTLKVTPTGAGGDYTIAVTPDSSLGTITPASGGTDTFNGNWRVTEQLSGGGTLHTLDSGTFSVTYTPSTTVELGEGGSEVVTIPAFTFTSFTGLPSGLIAANEAAQVDIDFDIQRASGSTEVSALSGAMTVTWTA
jgi:hypothetical protein